METPRTRWIAGCMTGTSLDGLDVVIARIEGAGLDIAATLHASASLDMPARLRATLATLTRHQPHPPLTFMQAARDLGLLHAKLLKRMIARQRNIHLDAVVVHGQTLWHAPHARLSWQLMDPWPIVRQLRVPVLYDLRQADLIAGGQGAPITPMSDWVLFHHPTRTRLVVNLGGICNVTLLPAGACPDQVRGEDISPCNLLIDPIVRHVHPTLRYDDGGRLAARGRIDPQLFERACQAPFFSRPRPRTTGREDFDAAWIAQLVQSSAIAGNDLIASAADAVARWIVDYAKQCDARDRGLELVLAGGGAANRQLVRRIQHHAKSFARVITSDRLGVPASSREALGFAVLGALSQDRQPITLPAVTGAHLPGRAGAWCYP